MTYEAADLKEEPQYSTKREGVELNHPEGGNSEGGNSKTTEGGNSSLCYYKNI